MPRRHGEDKKPTVARRGSPNMLATWGLHGARGPSLFSSSPLFALLVVSCDDGAEETVSTSEQAVICRAVELSISSSPGTSWTADEETPSTERGGSVSGSRISSCRARRARFRRT